MRERAANLAAAARALKEASGATAPFSLAFLTDRRRIANPEPILRVLAPGSAVIFRDYDAPRREMLARRYRAICGARGVFFLVAGDRALAARIGADGVHYPSWERPPARVTGVRLVTAAAHGADDLARAAALGADLALLSPVFPTLSHPCTEHLGASRFKALAAASPVPVLALGGVDVGNARLLKGPCVFGLGAIGAFSASGEKADSPVFR